MAGVQRHRAPRLCRIGSDDSSRIQPCAGGGTTQVVTLLLAGFAVSTMLSYSSYFVEVLDRDYGFGLRVLASWLHGSIGVPRWSQLGAAALLLLLSLIAAAMLSRRLNTLALEMNTRNNWASVSSRCGSASSL